MKLYQMLGHMYLDDFACSDYTVGVFNGGGNPSPSDDDLQGTTI